ncbi:UPF0389 protein CG9231 [Anastrepha obliqua]|uniref:UPF0389 protein CG9231 n=1 Tax=Anastrepha ludens TaxID=28586 RepID=UPI0023AFF62D|nr:UPF0389 protein CG9231 [Anastrepha ludens]XP_054736250.1 UPF0389 protein CG9231 [Anastrepha obliqua]
MFGVLDSIVKGTKYSIGEFRLRRSFGQETGKPIHGYAPNNLEKRFLVWSGKYKTVDEIPPYVSKEVMERCRNRMRIRMSNIMMALTVVGCCIMVYSGKQAAKSGDSVVKQNLDWHKKYNEESKKV